MSTTMIIWSFLIGTIGFGYFLYGKKSQNFIALISGILMMIYPIFVQNILISIITGFLLLAAPFFIK